MPEAEKYRKWESSVKRIHAKAPYKHWKLLAFCAILVGLVSSLWVWRPEGRVPFRLGGITRFSSEEEFFDYLSRYEAWYGYYGTLGGRPSLFIAREGAPEAPLPPSTPGRVSETTVQVKGIDEPDIVKTDGIHIYFSRGQGIVYPFRIEGEVGWTPPSSEVKVIRAFPPSDLSIKSSIGKSGEMLLTDNILVIFSYNEISGYDVSNPESPKEVWNIQLDAALVSARLYEGRIHFVTSSGVSTSTPLPLQPMKVKGETFAVEAIDIYHPVDLVPVDVVYTAVILDPREGKVVKSVSFVGFSQISVVYMSKEALYITYTYYPSPLKMYHEFLRERCGDLISAEAMAKIERLMGYDISDRAKSVELEMILASENVPMGEVQARLENYIDERKRELEVTGIVKIGLEEFEIVAQGEVPGRPLNQFSLDEEAGYLRIATTVEPRWMWGWWGGASANDVYVLDNELRVVGSVKDLGATERIYAVRFIGNKGYVVTFRETDPFYVIDLSDPTRPELKGELKIPGYSSYLHPIDENLILGIGKEDWRVKISLFDVSSPSNPKEVDKYVLDESWSDVLETHHAFLLDEKHEIFFLPAGERGYIFSYEGNAIEQLKEISAPLVRRAVYIEDYLYVVSEGSVVVLDEVTWEKVNEIGMA
jgi:uncharacterized secreted protein with C-terminal beta-propeller domain